MTDPWGEARVYTRARRHELVAGRIGDIPIPAANWWQFAAAALVLAALACTSGLWGTPTIWTAWPWPARIAMLPTPLLAFWLSGRIRPDGTNPFAAAAGLAVHAAGRWARWGAGGWDRRTRRTVIRIPVIHTQEDQ